MSAFSATSGKLTLKEKTAWRSLRKYHPYRYAVLRSWAPDLLKTYQKRIGAQHITNLDPETGGKCRGKFGPIISDLFAKEANESDQNNPYSYMCKGSVLEYQSAMRRRDEHAIELATHQLQMHVADEFSLYSQWASHVLNGRAIFNFSDALSSLMLFTDVSDIHLDSIQLPFDTVYLHFGRQPDVPINGFVTSAYDNVKRKEEMIAQIPANIRELLPSHTIHTPSSTFHEPFPFEGAYVSKANGLRVSLVGATRDWAREPLVSGNFIDFADDIMDYHIPYDQGITLGEALRKEREEVAEEHEAYLRQTFAQLEKPSHYGVEYGNVDDFIKAFRAVEAERRDAFECALRLVINGILYITSYSEDTEQKYPEEAPAERIAEIESAPSPELQAKLRKKIEDQGYRKIIFCGKKFETSKERAAIRNEGPDRCRTFKGRIGHWRTLDPEVNTRWKEFKRKWILPVPDPTGTKQITIYQVTPPDVNND
ncbi:MAG TPA: hypothetical protein V6D29_13660 [Leptolyngbyaceae cyanobacterium]